MTDDRMLTGSEELLRTVRALLERPTAPFHEEAVSEFATKRPIRMKFFEPRSQPFFRPLQ